MDGNYFANEDVIKYLNDNNQVAFRYLNNPNGSIDNIAGIFNKNKNILGMMPHPERVIDKNTGGIDGLKMFESLLSEFS
jgi:phosphoribosylformylglycinamidine synthase